MPEISPAEAVLSGRPITNADAVLEANKGIRWSRSSAYDPEKPFDFARAKPDDTVDAELWRNRALNDMVALKLGDKRPEDADPQGFVVRDVGDGEKVVVLYDGDKRIAAGRVTSVGQIPWLWGERGTWRPQDSKYWREGDDPHAKLGRWLALRDENRPYVKLQRELSRHGAHRRGNEAYSDLGARGVNETLIPPPQAVRIIDKFRDYADRISERTGMDLAYVEKGIEDLVDGRYDSPEAFDVVQWAHGELRDTYERDSVGEAAQVFGR